MAQKKKTNRIGNKLNSYLNNQWVGHAKWFKKIGSRARRALDKAIIRKELNEII